MFIVHRMFMYFLQTLQCAKASGVLHAKYHWIFLPLCVVLLDSVQATVCVVAILDVTSLICCTHYTWTY